MSLDGTATYETIMTPMTMLSTSANHHSPQRMRTTVDRPRHRREQQLHPVEQDDDRADGQRQGREQPPGAAQPQDGLLHRRLVAVQDGAGKPADPLHRRGPARPMSRTPR